MVTILQVVVLWYGHSPRDDPSQQAKAPRQKAAMEYLLPSKCEQLDVIITTELVS